MKAFINSYPFLIYLVTFIIALISSSILTPIFRLVAIKLNILDCPYSQIKTHKKPTPYLGGLAIWSGWVIALFVVRLFTHFPSGTLVNLRGIITGSLIVLTLGLIDDIVPKGIGFKWKFVFQITAAIALLFFDIRLHFVSPYIIAAAFTIFWVVAITNALNIIDIMDGLSGGVVFIASMAFLLISMRGEAIYVNFCAAALAGGALGFIPYNLSNKFKIFMGDTGSLTSGFILAAIAMGTSYTKINDLALIAPLLILIVPIYDTVLVSLIRWRKGKSPFLGSKDHFALRLEKMGFPRRTIIFLTYIMAVVVSIGAYLITRSDLSNAIMLLSVLAFIIFLITNRISKVKIE